MKLPPRPPGRIVVSHDRRASERFDAHARALLAAEGCPICRKSRDDEEDYFTWLFLETYHLRPWLAEFARGWGFCAGHGARLLELGRYAYQIAYFHAFAASHVRGLLAAAADGREARVGVEAQASCPACASIEAAVERNIFFLGNVLQSSEGLGRYGDPAVLCVRHLRLLLACVPASSFEHLAALHERALGLALASAEDAAVRGPSAPAALERLVQLTVGEDLRAWDRGGTAASAARERDPIAELSAALRSVDRCPACAEIQRASAEWFSWLDAAARAGAARIDDLLPACNRHVWQYMQRAVPSLRAAVALRLGRGEQATLRSSLGRLASEPAPAWVSWLPSSLAARRVERVRLEAAREAASFVPQCAVCERLRGAEERLLLLLFALLASPGQRTLYREGHGLCLRHLRRGLSLAPSAEVRAFLVSDAAARIGVLAWELDEALRKHAWRARPEARGAESTAWRRAVGRFSGFAEASPARGTSPGATAGKSNGEKVAHR